MRAVSLGHLQAAQEDVRLVRVKVALAGREYDDPDHVEGWDPETDVTTTCEIRADLAALRASAGLGGASRVAAVVKWKSTGSGLLGMSRNVELVDGLNEVGLELDGAQLGGTLQLEVKVILTQPDSDSPLAATRFGSILWEAETRSVTLEGSGAQFPVAHVSFRDSGLAGGLGAAWLLHFDSAELTDSGVGSMRLYMNTDHAAVKELLDAPEKHGMTSAAMRQDVFRQMVLQGLNHEELELDAEYPTDSLGELLATTLRRAFPERTLDEMRSTARHTPGEFEAHLQARGGFLR